MAIDEMFPNPTVKQVIFQITFPNLFYIENKIGAFQLKIMKEFPQSALLFRRHVLFADVGSENKLAEIPSDSENETSKKVWQFKSDKNFELHILGNSLDITSRYHKTYDLEGEDKFRDIIKFVLDCFLEITGIPIINRIGLRYVDECPIPSKDNSTFKSYYNSIFPLDRFDLADAKEMAFRTVTKRDKYSLIYSESLQQKENEYKLILDFDGFAENIDSNDYLKVTDDLHTIISDEYEETIKSPVYEYMRETRGT